MPAVRTWPTPNAYDLRSALGTGFGPRDPTTWVEREDDALTIWRTSVIASGPVTFRVRAGHESIEAEAWGDGAEEALEAMPARLGLDDPGPAAIADAVHPYVRDLIKKYPGQRIGRGRNVSEMLIGVIFGQRVTSGEAFDGFRRVAFAHGEPAPGPKKLRLPAQPQALRRLRPHELQQHGIDHKRALAILAAAHHARKIDRLADKPAEEACAFLQKIRGIGPWTAISTIAGTHGWSDAAIVGDYHLPHLVCFALAGEPRGSDARLLEPLEPYSGQRHRAIKLLMAGHIRAPRYGAKRAPWQFYVDRGTRRSGD